MMPQEMALLGRIAENPCTVDVALRKCVDRLYGLGLVTASQQPEIVIAGSAVLAEQFHSVYRITAQGRLMLRRRQRAESSPS